MVERKPRILFVTSYNFPSGVPGGVMEYTLGLADVLKRKNWEVFTVASKGKHDKDSLADFNVGRTVYLRSHGTRYPISLTMGEPCNSAMEKVIDQTRPDGLIIQEFFVPMNSHEAVVSSIGKPIKFRGGTVHAQVEVPGKKARVVEIAGKLMKKPVIIDEFPFFDTTPGYLNTIFDAFNGRIAMSKASAETARKVCKDNAHYEIIPNGFDVLKFRPNLPEMEGWRRNEDEEILFMTGRHEKRKGFDMGIRAFAKLLKSGRENIRLVIGGQGKDTFKLKKLAEKMGIKDNVLFVGFIKDEDLPRAYGTADIYLGPGRGGEGFGRVLIEALLCETFVLATQINGFTEAVEGCGAARLVVPNNPEILKNQMLEILNLGKEERQRLARLGREFAVKKYDWEVVGEKLSNYYSDHIGKPEFWATDEDWENAKRRKNIITATTGIIIDKTRRYAKV